MEQKHLMVAIEAALKAGKEILAVYDRPVSDFGIEKKTDNSPLTIADRKSHEVIVSMLKDTPFPVLSEEGRAVDYAVRKAWEALWIVDPLDGTKEFIKRNGEFTVNIAWVRQGIPVAGVIYVPVKRELFFAEAQMGAYKCTGVDSWSMAQGLDALLQRSQPLPLKEARGHFVVVASRSHLTPETEAYIDDLRKTHRNVEIVSAGSSLKICLVAEGKANVYPRFAPTMEWDTAAGHAIARAAGREIYRAGADVPLEYNKEDLLNPWFVCR